jgi:S1-C subfamily serine protease
MSTVYGPYSANDPETSTSPRLPYGAVPPPPPPLWPGGEGPAFAGGQAHGSASEQPGRHRRRRVMIMVAGASALAVAAGGSAWAAIGGRSGPLTTSEISSQTDPGLVDITSSLGYQQATAMGTGMVLTPTGEVLTNNHVVAGATSIVVRDIGNGRTYQAKVVGYSDSHDVAVLQLKGASGLSTVSIGNSASVAAGQRITALGNAEGKGGTPAVATGTVTATGATIAAEDDGDDAVEHLTGMIRTNANIEPGDSGGPLVNSSGQVVGMDTAASTSSSTGFGTTAAVTTTAFSIPINRALSLADQIEAGRSSATVHIGATAFLGVEVTSSSAGQNGYGGYGGYVQPSSGVAIEGVESGTAAAEAGLTGGDTIISVGGHQISSSADLQTVIGGYHPGDNVTVEWTDQFGQSQSATVTLTAGPTG